MLLFLSLTCACLMSTSTNQVNSQTVKRSELHKDVSVTVNTSHAINIVNDNFLSYTIDSSSYQPNVHWYRFNFSSPKIHTLMRALSPSMLRIGGTSSDWLFFDKPLTVIRSLHLLPKANILTKGDVVNLVDLTRSTGTELVFGLNLQLRFGMQWDPSNAIELLQFCSDMNFCEDFKWELGNEPDWFDPKRNNLTTLTGKQISNDFSILRRLLQNYSNCRASAIIGPDVGVPSTTLGNQIFSSVANSSGNFLEGLTFHHYYFNGQNASYKEYINPGHFNNLELMIKVAQTTVAKTQYPHTPLWLGETSSAYDSGTPNISDKYIAGFLWMDKLGLSAAMGLKVVMRQTLYGGNYALLNISMDPNPDYWLSWLHKLLVGRPVFNVTVTEVGLSNTARVYAHCTSSRSSSYRKGALTVFALNVDPQVKTVLCFTDDLSEETIDVYILEPDGPDGVLSQSVKLNGKLLKMPNEMSMPKAKPIRLHRGRKVELPPLTFGFLVFPDAEIELCMR